MTDERVDLYRQIAEHTRSACGDCERNYNCCHPWHCEEAMRFAEEQGVHISPQTSTDLPALGPNGCTVPPHLRPTCSVHHCLIEKLGFDPKNPEWTTKYFELRHRIDELELRALEG